LSRRPNCRSRRRARPLTRPGRSCASAPPRKPGAGPRACGRGGGKAGGGGGETRDGRGQRARRPRAIANREVSARRRRRRRSDTRHRECRRCFSDAGTSRELRGDARRRGRVPRAHERQLTQGRLDVPFQGRERRRLGALAHGRRRPTFGLAIRALNHPNALDELASRARHR
jgi:hypothetical protein